MADHRDVPLGQQVAEATTHDVMVVEDEDPEVTGTVALHTSGSTCCSDRRLAIPPI